MELRVPLYRVEEIMMSTSTVSLMATHPVLPTLSESDAKRELSGSRVLKEIKLFSFPYREMTAKLGGWCRESGYERVLTICATLAFCDPGESVTGRVSVERTRLAAGVPPEALRRILFAAPHLLTQTQFGLRRHEACHKARLKPLSSTRAEARQSHVSN